jgi:hypothetical protein
MRQVSQTWNILAKENKNKTFIKKGERELKLIKKLLLT